MTREKLSHMQFLNSLFFRAIDHSQPDVAERLMRSIGREIGDGLASTDEKIFDVRIVVNGVEFESDFLERLCKDYEKHVVDAAGDLVELRTRAALDELDEKVRDFTRNLKQSFRNDLTKSLGWDPWFGENDD